MDAEKIQELLLQLVQDMSYVKTKLENIDEQKIVSRLDQLESKTKEYTRVIERLEKESEKTEDYIRTSLQESKRQQTNIFISMGLAIFSSILTFIFSLFK